jgi:N-acetylmuramoyl-L-alanine amidase
MVDDISHKIEQLVSFLGFVAFIVILLLIANMLGFLPTSSGFGSTFADDETGPRVALVSGHAGFDSGAVCETEAGEVILREVDVVSQITEAAADRLGNLGFDTLVLEEYDPRLDGLQADVLLSLHADSCISASGYKAAYHVDSPTPMAGDRILECIDIYYADETGLTKDPHTVTVDMTEYHAFRKIDAATPAVILELGFMGGDRTLLTERQEDVAAGIANSLRCFLEQ